MKWFIIAILTANPSVPSDIISKPTFDTRELCREYVVKNYDELNERVNKKNDQHKSTPNLFHCVNDKPER
tara:strand:+ start:304 stop:513 length:210 start_codon:yes stop_codon:yes gene_type:complete